MKVRSRCMDTSIEKNEDFQRIVNLLSGIEQCALDLVILRFAFSVWLLVYLSRKWLFVNIFFKLNLQGMY